MRITILFILLLSSFGISAQGISEYDFKNSDWFVGIDGENLFKNDTIRISKLTAILPKKYSHMWSHIKMDYLKTDLFSTLQFRNNDTFIEEVDKDACGFNFSDQINWAFDTQTQSLQFYKNNNLIAEYEIISKETDFTEWSNNNEEKLIEISAKILTLELRKLRK